MHWKIQPTFGLHRERKILPMGQPKSRNNLWQKNQMAKAGCYLPPADSLGWKNGIENRFKNIIFLHISLRPQKSGFRQSILYQTVRG